LPTSYRAGVLSFLKTGIPLIDLKTLFFGETETGSLDKKSSGLYVENESPRYMCWT
jgi:hypothetical protein